MRSFLIIQVVFLIALLPGCGSKGYQYWEVSKFRMDRNALQDGEKIKLLYMSRGPETDKEQDFYYHFVVVSQETGDTVNILTAFDHSFSEDDGDKVFNFVSEDSPVTRLLQGGNLEDVKHIDDVRSVELKKFDKVARDPAFDHVADNNYPTVIGMIATTVSHSGDTLFDSIPWDTVMQWE